MAADIIGVQNPILTYEVTTPGTPAKARALVQPEYGPHASVNDAKAALTEAFLDETKIPLGYTVYVLEGEGNAVKPVEYWTTKEGVGALNSLTKKIPDVEAVNLEDLKFRVNQGTNELEYSIDGGSSWEGTGMVVPTSTADLTDVGLRINNEYKLQITYNKSAPSPTWTYIDGTGDNAYIDVPGLKPIENVKVKYNEQTGYLEISYNNGSSWIRLDGAYLAIDRGDSSSFVNIPTFVIDKTNVRNFVYGGESFDGLKAVNCIVLWGYKYHIQFYSWLHENYANVPVGTKIYFMSSFLDIASGYTTYYDTTGHSAVWRYTQPYIPTIVTEYSDFMNQLYSGSYARDNSVQGGYTDVESKMSDFYAPETLDYEYSIFCTTKVDTNNWTTLQYAGRILPGYYFNLKAQITGTDVGNTVTTWAYNETEEEWLPNHQHYSNGIFFGWEWDTSDPEEPSKGSKTPSNWETTVTFTNLEACSIEHKPSGFSVKEGGNEVVNSLAPGTHTLAIKCTETSYWRDGILLFSSDNQQKYFWLALSNDSSLEQYLNDAVYNDDYITVRNQYTNKLISNARVIKYSNSGEYCVTSTGKTHGTFGPSLRTYFTKGDYYTAYAPGYENYTSDPVSSQAGFVPRDVTVYLTPKEYSSVNLSITVQDLNGNTISGAEVTVDDTVITTTTSVFVGQHELKVTAYGYVAEVKTIYVSEDTAMNITLRPIPVGLTYHLYKGSNKVNGSTPSGQPSYSNTMYLGIVPAASGGEFSMSTGSLEILSVAPSGEGNQDFQVASGPTLIGLAERPVVDPHCVYSIVADFKPYSQSYAKTHSNKTPITVSFYGIDGLVNTFSLVAEGAFFEYQSEE